jgi:mono/diheme cytochrome c family protein
LKPLGVLAALSILAFAGVGAAAGPAEPSHFADADNDALATQGADIYIRNCSNCHGRKLQGQALWQLRDQYEGRRAPPHDSTGHTWQHSDEDLFYMTKYGHFAAAPPGLVSYMPAFEHSLSDGDILAVLAFIKSSWPVGIRASQSMLNPNHRGMPANADKVEWTLPPNCSSSVQRWSATQSGQ